MSAAEDMGMPRTTHPNRRARAKFPPEYARGLDVSDLPPGGPGRGAGLAAWQHPRPKETRGVIVCGAVKPRPCAVVPAVRAVVPAMRAVV